MFIVYLNNASWEKGEAPKGKKCQPPSQFTRAVDKDGR